MFEHINLLYFLIDFENFHFLIQQLVYNHNLLKTLILKHHI